MAESLDAFSELDQIRRELKALNRAVETVAKHVDEVDKKVERSRTTQLGALASTMASDGDVPKAVILRATGMTVPDIAAALGKSENAVRLQISRFGRK